MLDVLQSRPSRRFSQCGDVESALCDVMARETAQAGPPAGKGRLHREYADCGPLRASAGRYRPWTYCSRGRVVVSRSAALPGAECAKIAGSSGAPRGNVGKNVSKLKREIAARSCNTLHV